MRCADTIWCHDCSRQTLMNYPQCNARLYDMQTARLGEYWIIVRVELSGRGVCRLPTWSVNLQADVATVLRDGRLHVIPASELVPGDIVEIAGMLSWRMPHAVEPLSAVVLAPRRPCDSVCNTRIR